jgi:hypothetical protein
MNATIMMAIRVSVCIISLPQGWTIPRLTCPAPCEDCSFPVPSAGVWAEGECCEGLQPVEESERANFVETFLFQRCDCDAFFLADRLPAFEFLTPLLGVKVSGVEIHIRHDRCEYDRQSDVDDLDIFHAALDDLSGF